MASLNENYRLIETTGDLEQAARDLSGEAWICLDTEFVRVKTYFPKLCLLQIGTMEQIWCIDAITCPSLEPIVPVLFDPKTVKVFHSAQQDLEVLQQFFGRVPAPLFDTQVAAAALGLGEQISYRELVVKCCGVELDKSHTRTDWSTRPLSPERQAAAGMAGRGFLRDRQRAGIRESRGRRLAQGTGTRRIVPQRTRSPHVPGNLAGIRGPGAQQTTTLDPFGRIAPRTFTPRKDND
jgi:hypothetical protein